MTWADWQRVQLHLLRSMLRTHYVELVAARAVWTTIKMPPTDPLRVELDWAIAGVVVLGKLVAERLSDLDYRPGVQPYTGSGMNAKLRPDFAVRGITRRD